jgi:hypothetical protein
MICVDFLALSSHSLSNFSAKFKVLISYGLVENGWVFLFLNGLLGQDHLTAPHRLLAYV